MVYVSAQTHLTPHRGSKRIFLYPDDHCDASLNSASLWSPKLTCFCTIDTKSEAEGERFDSVQAEDWGKSTEIVDPWHTCADTKTLNLFRRPHTSAYLWPFTPTSHLFCHIVWSSFPPLPPLCLPSCTPSSPSVSSSPPVTVPPSPSLPLTRCQLTVRNTISWSSAPEAADAVMSGAQTVTGVDLVCCQPTRQRRRRRGWGWVTCRHVCLPAESVSAHLVTQLTLCHKNGLKIKANVAKNKRSLFFFLRILMANELKS